MWRCASRTLAPLFNNSARTLLSAPRTCLHPPLVVPLSDQHYAPFNKFFSAEASKPIPFSAEGDEVVDVDEDLGIATGVELEELLAEKEGKKLFDLDPPRGPFGTKERPAIIQSRYDERIVGCSGGVGEDEHDVVWFRLKKGELYECTVCTQVFQLEVVGPGGPPHN